MLNNLKNLKDIQVISRDQQSKIQGGYPALPCIVPDNCGSQWCRSADDIANCRPYEN
mgnify:CR=1 FL=1